MAEEVRVVTSPNLGGGQLLFLLLQGGHCRLQED
jgi:hypothetical protein